MRHDHIRSFQRSLWDVQRRREPFTITSDISPFTHSVVPTGYAVLDRALAASGIASGRLTALTGALTSGLTTLTLHIIAHAQAENATAVYLDPSGTFDADYAARCGIALDRLLIIQPRGISQALAITDDLLRAGLPSFLVLDTVGVPLSDLSALTRRHHGRGTLLILASRPSTGLLAAVHTALHAERVAWMRRHEDITGCRTQITIRKDKPDTGEKRVIVEIEFPAGTEGKRW